jgi:alpha-glucuronidase
MNMTNAKKYILCVFLIISLPAFAEDGYELWLRYPRIADARIVKNYSATLNSLYAEDTHASIGKAAEEITLGLSGLIGKKISATSNLGDGSIALLTAKSTLLDNTIIDRLKKLGREGFVITHATIRGKKTIVIGANEPVGVLYGAFEFLRQLQIGKGLHEMNIDSKPSIERRILNHWDNLDRTIERGYAGFSLWDWHKLPDYIDPRYYDYARANASVGINGTVLTNVNANALVITDPYLQKVKALADIFRPYGIRVYLTARFSAPIEIGGLSTADPLEPKVQQWWKDKTAEIYKIIPDFGGFLVKANSEGQPGPQNYGRTHADGANMLADAVAPFGGIVMWRAFVYTHENKTDRVKQAYNEFMPLDDQFRKNVLVQVKNGPLDFQPREPFHPLFGAMKSTPLVMEFQLTQEYLGYATHLVFLPTLFKEVLDADTFQKGKGSTVRKAIDGTLYGHSISAIAGVSNIGNDRNWTGHPFAAANWYGFGRMAWNLDQPSNEIAREWIQQTFSTDNTVVSTLEKMMMESREITVNYMTPLGLHHIMGWDHHYGPAPWIKDKPREDWTSVYYHKADANGIGFNRTASGSNALEQYHPQVAQQYDKPETCPDEYLLWFHHLPWEFKMKNGKTLWDELCFRYYGAANDVKKMNDNWAALEGKVDDERHRQVSSLLAIQHKEACWWRDACVTYFQSFSKREIPSPLQKPANTLEYYQSLQFPYAPGIRPRW